MIPVENPKPYDTPDPPVFPPLPPKPAPGDDGDRDQEDADIETPVPVTLPTWQDANRATLVLTPVQIKQLQESVFIQPDCSDDLTAYHAHTCPCPACELAHGQQRARLNDYFSKHNQW